MKFKAAFPSLFLLAVSLFACTVPVPLTVSPTSTAPSAPCEANGTIASSRVPSPTQGFKISFQYYLPPCYADQAPRSYPVLYFITLSSEYSLSGTDNTPMSLANRLIRAGEIPPAILVIPDPIIGYGSDAALTLDLVPYIDSQLRTNTDAHHRGVGGISHGAAIAVRMAFQFPETFGSAGLLSGGIVLEEQDKFSGWITRTPPGQWPRVLIDVGGQDGIMSLTKNLTDVLDLYQVPYTLNIGQGTHSWEFWSSQMESYILWFAEEWQ